MTLRVSQGRELPPDCHMFTTAYVCPRTINCLKSCLCHSETISENKNGRERTHALDPNTCEAEAGRFLSLKPARAKLRSPVSKPPKRSQILHVKYSICVAKETSRVIKMA